MNAIETGEKCRCGGNVDRLYLFGPMIYQGRCSRCGEKYTVVERQPSTKKIKNTEVK